MTRAPLVCARAAEANAAAGSLAATANSSRLHEFGIGITSFMG